MSYQTLHTQAGFDSIKKEHDDLMGKRPQYVIELTRARDLGDRSENGAYKEARSRLSRTDSRLRFLKKVLDHAKVVAPSIPGVISIGSIVKVKIGDVEKTLYVVGEHEANPAKGRVSYRSPVGQALSGKRAGDVVTVEVPNGIIAYTILSVDQ